MNCSNNTIQSDRIIGSVLASALGDAFGAPYEGGILERALWFLIGRRKGKRCWTDDTRMSIDLMESLLACGRVNQDDLAQRFAQSYQWSRGYGPGAAKLLKRIRQGEDWQVANRSVYPDGSYGNGGAMRAAPIGLFYGSDNEELLVQEARASAQITHAHALAQEGAVLIALAVAFACDGLESLHIIERLGQHVQSEKFRGRLERTAEWLQAEMFPTARIIAAELGNGMAAVESCVSAIYLGLRLREGDFADLLVRLRQLGGDVDTIGAMAGAIWGAARGQQALPEEYLQQLEQREHLEQLGAALAQVAMKRPTK